MCKSKYSRRSFQCKTYHSDKSITVLGKRQADIGEERFRLGCTGGRGKTNSKDTITAMWCFVFRPKFRSIPVHGCAAKRLGQRSASLLVLLVRFHRPLPRTLPFSLRCACSFSFHLLSRCSWLNQLRRADPSLHQVLDVLRENATSIIQKWQRLQW